MNIIFGDHVVNAAKEKYTILELDTFKIEGEFESIIGPVVARSGPVRQITAYALIENTPLQEMSTLETFKELHSNLMQEYRSQNWKYCEDAMEHLQGKWNGELDTFYTELYDRIQSLKTQSLDSTWTGIILRSA
jgi:hypothetical protein